jgi:hypothetical protein
VTPRFNDERFLCLLAEHQAERRGRERLRANVEHALAAHADSSEPVVFRLVPADADAERALLDEADKLLAEGLLAEVVESGTEGNA